MSSKGEGEIRIVLVDDHEMVREGLSALLSQSPGVSVAGSYRSPEKFLAAGVPGPLDVITICPDGRPSCVKEVEALRDAYPGAGILMLAAHEQDCPILAAIRVGVRGYLVKSAPFEHLVLAIQTVARGASYVSPLVSAWFLDRIQNHDRGSRENAMGRLSPREVEVMNLVARGKSSKEVAATLNLELETVRGYRKNLMRKLGVNKVAALTRLALASAPAD